MKKLFIALALASAGLATSAHAAKPVAKPAATNPVANGQGRQAAECFAMYKMAADAPQNSGAEAQKNLKNFQGLMTWSMDRYKVSQKQFTGWTDALMTQLGKASDKTRPTLMGDKVQSCNVFAKGQYEDYMKEKSAPAPAAEPVPASK